MKKVILITGCSSGFGLTTAKYLSDKGYTVVPTMRKKEDLSLLPNSVQLDVTWEQEKIDKVIADVVKKFGGIDVAFNNAGYGYQGYVEYAEIDEVKRQFETNFFGVFKVIKAVLPYMKKVKKGLILNTSSILGLISIPEYGIYSASKFAVEAMSKALRLEIEKDNIKVVVINPGGFKTEFNKKSVYNYKIDFKPKGYGLEPIELSRLVEKIIETDKPKNNYIIGKEALSIKLIRMLPDSISEMLIKKNFS